MKIFLGIPCNRGVKAKTVESLGALISATSHEIKLQIATEGYTIAENRSYLVYRAKEWGADYILFIDDDMVFPSDTLDRLLSREKEVIGINSHGRKLPLQTTVTFFEKDWKESEDGTPIRPEIPQDLFECKEVGGGVLLISMQVFEKIRKPWFKFEEDESGWTKQGEDGWFCQQVRETGIQIWCDPTLEIGHIGDFIY